MPPLILHNVPDDELYVGEDGVQRPYAMLFAGNEIPGRSRKMIPETGSFGKSTRRSRSRTGTPATKPVDPTIAAGEAIMAAYINKHIPSESTLRKPALTTSISQPNISANFLASDEPNANNPARYVRKDPTEVILRGFQSTHQYAAIREYECIAGRICEDYPRDPPFEQRKYKTDLRDPATLQTQPLTKEERRKALQYAGGAHWIKVTFESAEAADSAIEHSPQVIQGYIVAAEPYRGVPPVADLAIPVGSLRGFPRGENPQPTGYLINSRGRQSSTMPRSQTTPLLHRVQVSTSPGASHASSHTVDSATLGSSVTAYSATITDPTQEPSEKASNHFCKVMTGARPMKLLPAEQALLPQKSWTQQMISRIPIINWFSSDIIGTQIPRDERDEFDWSKASMYWKVVCWIDSYLGIFGIVHEKED